mmetsp:Transcript_41919/g.125340  ORF Transcript_41919/g.125340 Transcript_41919/m.125340 type:complete len:449 (+) Transcript_41919:49-1395(+)
MADRSSMPARRGSPEPAPVVADLSFHDILAQAAAEYDSLQGRYLAVVWENSRLRKELGVSSPLSYSLGPKSCSAGSPASDAWQVHCSEPSARGASSPAGDAAPVPGGDLGTLRVSPSVGSGLRTRPAQNHQQTSGDGAPLLPTCGHRPLTPVRRVGRMSLSGSVRLSADGHRQGPPAVGCDSHAAGTPSSAHSSPDWGSPSDLDRTVVREDAASGLQPEEAAADGPDPLPHSELWVPCSPPLTSRASSQASRRRSPRSSPRRDVVLLRQAGHVFNISAAPLFGDPADEAVLETPRAEAGQEASAPAVPEPPGSAGPRRAKDGAKSPCTYSGTEEQSSPVACCQDPRDAAARACSDDTLSTDDAEGQGVVAMKLERFTAEDLEVSPPRALTWGSSAPGARGFAPRALAALAEGSRAPGRWPIAVGGRLQWSPRSSEPEGWRERDGMLHV